MKCPTCGCTNFYIKDEDDEYEIYVFNTSGEEIVFDETLDQDEIPQITPAIETFCNQCAWHGEFNTISD
ncbi:MAG: hypothetical protein ABIJ59_15075 [Pseudomonadota bacterium]